jgi:DNA-binding PadR family transcriptional regulator
MEINHGRQDDQSSARLLSVEEPSHQTSTSIFLKTQPVVSGRLSTRVNNLEQLQLDGFKYNKFMKSPRSKYAILGMLSIRPRSGYDIKKAVEGSISYFWTESYGQIYPLLKKLVAERLATKSIRKQAGKPDRHVYALTTKGRKALQTWLADDVMPTVQRNELLLKLLFGQESSIAVNIKHVEEYRRRQTKRHEECKTIQLDLRSQERGTLAEPYWLMTVNYGVRIAKARMDWCDDTLAALNKMSKANNRKKK